MKVIRTIFLFFLLFFIGCEKNSYNEILHKAKTLNWYNDMVEAKEALELTRMAMAKKPKKWDAYSLELSIYSSWNHKSKDYSNNFNGIKSVYEKWLENGNKMSVLQKFGYANTLYCLDDYGTANKLYLEVIEYYNENKEKLIDSEKDYICYMMSNIMLYDISEKEFGKIKIDLYDKNQINEYVISEINNIGNEEKKNLAERYCNV